MSSKSPTGGKDRTSPLPASKLTVAVIGGGYGRFHIKGFLDDPERFHLKLVCDQSPDAMERLRKECALPATCKVCSDYHEVLNDPEIDAVAISLPHHLHAPVSVEAARNKKHILLDKPIARTLAEADQIIQAARENQVTLMIAHNQRFFPLLKKLREQVTTGAIGKPIYAATRHDQNFNPPAGAAWRSKQSVGGGCVMGSGVHNLDLMRWLFGEPVEVFAYGVKDPQRLEAEAATSISFRFETGLVVNFTCNWARHGAVVKCGEWEVFGTRGDIATFNDGLSVGHEFGQSVEHIPFSDPWQHQEMYTHFFNCIAKRTAPLTSGPEGRASLALVLKVYESIELGRPVRC